MKALTLAVALASAATPVNLAPFAGLQAPPAGSHARVIDPSLLEAAAHVQWPLLDPVVEQVIIENRARLGDEARQEWASDRALPMLAGELPAADDVLHEVLHEVARATQPSRPNANVDLVRLQTARNAYAARQLKVAVDRYAAVTQGSPLWPDALRERAWTLLLLGRPGEALGATVSLAAPYFPAENHAEARLMTATVLLQKCRFQEARNEIAALADAPVDRLDEKSAREALQRSDAPGTPRTAAAWSAPLVTRVRAALVTTGALAPDDPVRTRLVALGTRLMVQAFDAETELVRDAKERALKIRYEALRAERGLIDRGDAVTKPKPSPLPPLDDDEVAWTFDGTFWRDELGNYRYSAGDACLHRTSP